MTQAAAATEKKYHHLSANFFRGSVKGQIASVYKDREANPEKVAEYKKALAEGEASLGAEITKQQARKLAELNIAVPDSTKVVSPRRAEAEAPAAE